MPDIWLVAPIHVTKFVVPMHAGHLFMPKISTNDKKQVENRINLHMDKIRTKKKRARGLKIFDLDGPGWTCKCPANEIFMASPVNAMQSHGLRVGSSFANFMWSSRFRQASLRKMCRQLEETMMSPLLFDSMCSSLDFQ